jgi:formiminotetrahydrofolate cyclodeaminase
MDDVTPFASIESAHEYTKLLLEAIEESRAEIAADVAQATEAKDKRLQEALQLVAFKLDKLKDHLAASHRLLNDLRTLRRLLLAERGPGGVPKADGRDDPDWSNG